MPDQPNIVLMLADDMGFADLGCFGAEIPTPNLDALASNGWRFSQMYNCARCCPSRASLLTGLYPHQAGVGAMLQNQGTPAYQGYLRDDCVTIAEVLGKAGYFTGYTGKWHTGGVWPRREGDPKKWRFDDPTHPTPRMRGFERFYGNPSGGGSYFEPAAIAEDETLVELPDDFYTTDSYTTKALDMMDEATASQRPFFLHICYNAPHWPLHAKTADIERHRGVYEKGWDYFRTARHEELKGLGILSERWDISPRDPQVHAWEDEERKDWEALRMATYAAMVDCLDQNVGRVVRKLRELGQLENTILIFLSDNGGCHEFLPEGARKHDEVNRTRDGRHIRFGNIEGLTPGGVDTFMSYDRPWANVSNAPFRMFKHWVHEGGISAPFILSWPAKLREPAIVHEPCHIIDIAATCIDAAGADYPEQFGGKAVTPIEGESFLDLLDGNPWRRHEPIFWEHMGNEAVREDVWKLVRKKNGPWELYNLENDRTELHDLIGGEAERATRMRGMYDHWAERCGVLPRP